MDRLSNPHPTIAETSQAYSTFNSTYAPSTYEESMVKASKVASKSTARWDAREAWEQGWTTLSSQEEDDAQRMQKVAYLYAYLEMELATGKGKKVEPGMVVRVYERWVAVCAGDASREGRVAEAGVWDKYITYVVRPECPNSCLTTDSPAQATTNGFSKAQLTETTQRAVRCCPHSGELWARLLRHHEILNHDPQVIGETYMDALALGVLTRKGASAGKRREKVKGKDKKKGKGKAEPVVEEVDVEPVVALGDARGADVAELAALEAAWAGYMRRMEEGNGDQGG
jgi:hypothetical protein